MTASKEKQEADNTEVVLPHAIIKPLSRVRSLIELPNPSKATQSLPVGDPMCTGLGILVGRAAGCVLDWAVGAVLGCLLGLPVG